MTDPYLVADGGTGNNSARPSTHLGTNIAPSRFRAVLDDVCRDHGMSRIDVLNPPPRIQKKLARREYSQARHDLMWRLRGYGYPLMSIARAMGLTDHTTIIYGIRRHTERLG